MSPPRKTAATTAAPYDARPWLAAYPAGVPADIAVSTPSLTQLLDEAATAFGSRIAITFLGTSLTYRDVLDAAVRLAGALQRLGVGPGDRVALVLPSCPQAVLTLFATWRLGAVAVPLNPLLTAAELHEQLADCGVRVVVCLDKTYQAVTAARAGTSVEAVVVTSVADYLPTLRRNLLRLPLPAARARRAQLVEAVPRAEGVHAFLPMLRAGGAAPPHPGHPDEAAVILYTGGTTGRTRGAVLSHTNLAANAHQVRAWLPDAVPGREVTLGVLPLFHSYGLTFCVTATVLLGGKLVLLPRFDIPLLLQAVDEHRPTIFPGVPPIFQALADAVDTRRHDLRGIRFCLSGAMRLPRATQDAFERVTGCRLVEGYGLTEAAPATHANPVDGARRVGSIGVPLPGTHARVVDLADPDRPAPVGEPGELAVRGPQVFRGYWGPPPAERLFTADGFLLTGDVAVMDADGYFTVVDRKKELIVTGGYNVYPAEVEAAVATFPGVVDCAVAGVPDRYRGEAVTAFVVLADGARLDADALREHCAASLAPYKLPRVVQVVSRIPRSPVGKTLRRLLVNPEDGATTVARPPRPRPRKRAGRSAAGGAP